MTNFLCYCKYVVLLLLLPVLFSCSSLPDYARPQLYVPNANEGAVVSLKGFSYRKLTIADFQAKSLPAGIKEYANRLHAHSCINIHLAPDFSLQISRAVFYGHLNYIGSISNFSFQASFVPACSWWNPKVPANRKAYVLQHEQIHFAITELTSRKINQQVGKKLKEYIAFGNTSSEVASELTAKVEKLAKAIMQEDLKIHTAFDEDTSGFYNPMAQRKWLTRVQRRLAGREKLY